MTTPTEDHWAGKHGADLVAELRKAAGRNYPVLAGTALLRAADAIEELAVEIERLERHLDSRITG